MSRTRYKKGDWNVIEDIGGKQVKSSKTQLRWDGHRVLKCDYEERHPQDFIRAIPDDPSVPWTRSESQDNYLDERAFLEDVQLVSNDPQAYEYMGLDVDFDADGDTLVVAAHRRDLIADGSELIPDNSFDDAGDWELGDGWAISGGKARCNGTQTAESSIQQSGVLNIGQSVEIIYTVSNLEIGTFTAYAGSGTAGTSHTSNGTYTQTLTVTGSTDFYILVSSSFNADIEIVSAIATADLVDTGAAYIFVRDGLVWSQEAILEASVSAGSLLGNRVDISSDGNTVVLGAPGNDLIQNDQGSLVIFTRSGSTWSEEQHLVHPTPATTNSYLGYSVALSDDGNTVVAGSYGDDTNQGAVHVWTRSGTTWTYLEKLTYTSGGVGDRIGVAASISGDGNYIWAGAPWESASTGYAVEWKLTAGVYVENAQITAVSPVAGENFSYNVVPNYDGSYIYVGAWSADVDGISGAGRVDIFSRSGGVPVFSSSIENPTPSAGDSFGGAIGINKYGDRFIISAVSEDIDASNAGGAYEYSRSGATTTFVKRLIPSEASVNDYIGRSAISSNGQYAVLTSVDDDVTFIDQGSVWIFTK